VLAKVAVARADDIVGIRKRAWLPPAGQATLDAPPGAQPRVDLVDQTRGVNAAMAQA